MKTYWVSNKHFTCRVSVNDAGVVSDTAPILSRRFLGRPWWQLRQWLETFDGAQIEELYQEGDEQS